MRVDYTTSLYFGKFILSKTNLLYSGGVSRFGLEVNLE